jgi:hypothetical protein
MDCALDWKIVKWSWISEDSESFLAEIRSAVPIPVAFMNVPESGARLEGDRVALIRRKEDIMQRSIIAMSVVFAVALCSVFVAHAVECPAEPSRTPPKVSAAMVIPGIYRNVTRTFEETVFLPPLVEGKDFEPQSQDSPVRIGVHRSIPAESKGKWREISGFGGQIVMRLAIQSPEAVMIRPHFASFPPADAATVYVYGDDPETAEGPVVKPESIGTGDFWGPPIRTENYVIEVVLLSGDHESHLPVIDKISHVYVDAFSQTWESIYPDGCMIDLSCKPAYAKYGAGVAAIASESGDDATLFCTGALLNDLDKTTQIPWFLTANHCDIDEKSAPHTYYYFHFQTAACNGEPPQLTETPRVDGAYHVFSSGDSDVTLLRLRGKVPPATTLLGWKTDPVEAGVQTFCIHHPGREFKRISFGYTSSEGDKNRVQNNWTDGVTDKGSSGSPLFNSDGLIIGQLYLGYSSCGGSLQWDLYGRYSVSWANGLSRYLKSRFRPPVITSFRLGDGSGYTAKRTVTLTLKGFDNPTHYKVSEDANFAGAGWRRYSSGAVPVLTFTLSEETGDFTVYAKLRNKAGESASVSASITLMEKPTVKALTINDGAQTTAGSLVTLNNLVTGFASHYMASEHRDFRHASWEPYSPAPSFTLGPGIGKKTVYFKVRNPAATSAVTKASIEVTGS